MDSADLKDKRILLVAQKSAETDDPGAADLFEIGTLAQVLQQPESDVAAACAQLAEEYRQQDRGFELREAWSRRVSTGELNRWFEDAVEADDPRLRTVFNEAYADLSRSVLANGGHMPAADEAFEDVRDMISDGELNIQRVNSDVQLEPLLDQETAELRLRTKANLFIGGSILDRGITVPNLIAFYYGRNPKRMQADTVLQHSRMYGARPKDDLAVTRLYTSRGVYTRLSQIHALETALREAFESNVHGGGVATGDACPHATRLAEELTEVWEHLDLPGTQAARRPDCRATTALACIRSGAAPAACRASTR